MQLFLRILAFVLGFSAAAARADISSSIAPPPQADPVDASVQRGSEVKIDLRGHYGGAGYISFWIVRPPEQGSLSQLRSAGGNSASITYRNNGDVAATSDHFSYIIQAGGRVSSAAEVRIRIEEPPPRLQLPPALDFGEVVAGEGGSRSLLLRNTGGGKLEGHLSVSAPWKLSVTEFHLGAGETQTVTVNFLPEEPRSFVGQVSLTTSGGGEEHVSLNGNATAPLRIRPDPLVLAGETRATVFLSNLTSRDLALSFATADQLQPIEPLQIPAGGESSLTIALRPEVRAPNDITLAIVGAHFRQPYRVRVSAPPPSATPSPPPPAPSSSPASGHIVSPSRSPVAASTPFAPAASTPLPAAGESAPRVVVSAHRISASRWELQWPMKDPSAAYGVEERELARGGGGELQISWRKLPVAKQTSAHERVTAQLDGLAPNQLHMLRVRALAPDDTLLWESNLIALQPLPPSSHRRTYLLLLLALILAGAIYWRRRAQRTEF